MAWRPPEARLADVQEAHRLKAEGMKMDEIANYMGVGRSTISNYLNSPNTGDLYKRRKRQWSICSKCGGRMSYGASQCKKCYRRERGIID